MHMVESKRIFGNKVQYAHGREYKYTMPYSILNYLWNLKCVYLWEEVYESVQ